MNSKIKSSYDKPLFEVKQYYFTITQSTVYKDYDAQFDYKQIQTFLLTSQHLLNFYFLHLLSLAHIFSFLGKLKKENIRAHNAVICRLMCILCNT